MLTLVCCKAPVPTPASFGRESCYPYPPTADPSPVSYLTTNISRRLRRPRRGSGIVSTTGAFVVLPAAESSAHKKYTPAERTMDEIGGTTIAMLQLQQTHSRVYLPYSIMICSLDEVCDYSTLTRYRSPFACYIIIPRPLTLFYSCFTYTFCLCCKGIVRDFCQFGGDRARHT